MFWRHKRLYLTIAVIGNEEHIRVTDFLKDQSIKWCPYAPEDLADFKEISKSEFMISYDRCRQALEGKLSQISQNVNELPW